MFSTSVKTSVKCTTRFLAGKMLMFAKLSFTEPEFRLILFKIFLRTEIRDRFDKSDDFWKDLTYTTFQIKKF